MYSCFIPNLIPISNRPRMDGLQNTIDTRVAQQTLQARPANHRSHHKFILSLPIKLKLLALHTRARPTMYTLSLSPPAKSKSLSTSKYALRLIRPLSSRPNVPGASTMQQSTNTTDRPSLPPPPPPYIPSRRPLFHIQVLSLILSLPRLGIKLEVAHARRLNNAAVHPRGRLLPHLKK